MEPEAKPFGQEGQIGLHVAPEGVCISLIDMSFMGGWKSPQRTFVFPPFQTTLEMQCVNLVGLKDLELETQLKRLGLPPGTSAQTTLVNICARSVQALRTLTGYTNIHKAVFCVPPYFNDARRQACKDAVVSAGLTCLRIINEPTAASICLGLNTDEKAPIKYYLGLANHLGDFHLSTLNIEEGIFEIMASGTLGSDSTTVAQKINAMIAAYSTHRGKPVSPTDLSKWIDIKLRTGQYPEELIALIPESKLEELYSEATKLTKEEVERVANAKVPYYDGLFVYGSKREAEDAIDIIQETFPHVPLINSLDESHLLVARGAAIQASILTSFIQGSYRTPFVQYKLTRAHKIQYSLGDDFWLTIVYPESDLPLRVEKTWKYTPSSASLQILKIKGVDIPVTLPIPALEKTTEYTLEIFVSTELKIRIVLHRHEPTPQLGEVRELGSKGTRVFDVFRFFAENKVEPLAIENQPLDEHHQ